jgi:aminoacyl tRNA synthase complex-interacting multifunctional protein 1
MEEVNPKKKVLERLFPDLKTGPDGTPNYKGVPFMTSQGPVTSTLPNGSVA